MGKVVPLRKPSSLGWRPDRNLTEAQWLSAGRDFLRQEAGLQWALGDWYNYGSSKYGDRKAKCEEAGFNPNTLHVYGSVARAFESVTRVTNLSFKHHQVAMSAPVEERLKWLERAGQSGWSVQTLFDKIGEAKRKAEEKKKKSKEEDDEEETEDESDEQEETGDEEGEGEEEESEENNKPSEEELRNGFMNAARSAATYAETFDASKLDIDHKMITAAEQAMTAWKTLAAKLRRMSS